MSKEIYGLYTGFKDFPGRYAVSLFMPGCNLNCWYCHNKEVAKAGDGKITAIMARIVGYYRPVAQWNAGKQQEFKDRKFVAGLK